MHFINSFFENDIILKFYYNYKVYFLVFFAYSICINGQIEKMSQMRQDVKNHFNSSLAQVVHNHTNSFDEGLVKIATLQECDETCNHL